MPSASLSLWIGFHIGLVLLLATELIYARRQNRLGRPIRRTAIAATALWVAAALAFAGYLLHHFGSVAAVQYLAGYALEESLSIDNLFVFLLLFRLFAIERPHQPKVLFWGVAGAILMRGLFIAGGLTLLDRFAFVGYIFGAFLLVAAIRLFFGDNDLNESAPKPKEPRWIGWLRRIHPISTRQDSFFVREPAAPGQPPRRMVTVLFLTLLAIELTDVVFALDSIPAVLSITRHPFLAYSSNIMAVMGLRSLYFLLIGMLARLRFLHFGLATLLTFAAVKMLIAHWIEIGPLTSLAIIVTVLLVTVVASLWLPGQKPPQPPSAAP